MQQFSTIDRESKTQHQGQRTEILQSDWLSVNYNYPRLAPAGGMAVSEGKAHIQSLKALML